MKRITLSRLSGLLLTMLGLMVMIGWYTHQINLITLVPGAISIAFNSACGFFLTGLVLLIPNSKPTLQKNAYIALGSILAVCAMLILSQNLFNYTLGIDQFFVHVWLPDQNPYPGRMGDNSAFAFLFAGLAFILLPFIKQKIGALLAQLFVFSVIILGISALLGYLSHLEVLYAWHQYAQMSFPSAVGHSILGAGLWLAWDYHTQQVDFYAGKEEKKIISVTVTTFFSLILLIIAMIITALPHKNEGSYHLIHEQMEPAMLLVIIAGMSVLLWQLIALIRKIIQSDKKITETNINLKDSEGRFRSAFDLAAVGMALISPQNQFLKVNQALCDIVGYSETELLLMNINDIVHTEDLKTNEKFMQKMLGGEVKTAQSAQRYLRKSGEIIWVSINLSVVENEQQKPLYFIAQLQNITNEKKSEEQLRHLAYHDGLTDLLNRNRLEAKLEEILALAKRHDEGFAVIFLDLDRFKNINDTIGHDAGDLLLQVVAKRLKNTVRSTDLLARVGGDEFVIVLNELNKVDKIANIVDKIVKHLLQPMMIKGHEVYVTMSIGISVYPYDGNNIETLLKNADLALYRAKELGRNNYQFCTPEMTSKAQEKMLRQNALVHALAKNEFFLYYQLQVNLVTRQICGVEALLRWHNPDYSNVTIGEIIHLAEETGLIIPLNDWVLKTACEQVKTWHAAGFFPLTLSVNLSARQFKQTNFTDALLHTVEKMEFPFEQLELEITEDLIMQDPEYILNTLNILKAKGIQIAIDDFGTGYSSLDYLRRFPIDKIKIDQTFVQKINTDETSAAMIMAIIAMANKLNIKTVAEGVETKEQYDFLCQEKCTIVQGYYLSRPCDAEATTKLLESYLSRKSTL